MRYLKLDTDTTKDEFEKIKKKIEDLGYETKELDFYEVKNGYVYLYRGLRNKVMGQYRINPFKFSRKFKDSFSFGKEMNLNEFFEL